MYPLEELARAMMRDRQDELRRIRWRAAARAQPTDSLRSRLARGLFQLALRLDARVNGGTASPLTLADRRKSSRV